METFSFGGAVALVVVVAFVGFIWKKIRDSKSSTPSGGGGGGGGGGGSVQEK